MNRKHPTQTPSLPTSNPEVGTSAPLENCGRRDFLRKSVGGTIAIGLFGGAVATAVWKALNQENSLNGHRGNSENIRAQVELHFRSLSGELQAIWLDTKAALNGPFMRLKEDVRSGGEEFSDKTLTRRSIAALIIAMARDIISNGGRADAWFEENLMPYMQPAFDRFESKMNDIEGDFETRFITHIDRFNQKVAITVQAESPVDRKPLEMDHIEENTRQALARGGVKSGPGMGLGIGLTLVGAAGYIHTAAMVALLERLKRLLVRLLRPIATRVAARLGATVITAKLPPLSIIIMALGSAVTTYEIVRLRSAARRDFARALEESLEELEAAFERDVKLPFIQQLAYFQENADQIQNDIVRKIV